MNAFPQTHGCLQQRCKKKRKYCLLKWQHLTRFKGTERLRRCWDSWFATTTTTTTQSVLLCCRMTGGQLCLYQTKPVRCVALPPPLSARGRMSTFSLDPWQNPTTKLHRETGNAQAGCYSAKPPLMMSHSRDAVSSPIRHCLDGQTDAPPSLRCTLRGNNQEHTRCVL